MNTKMLVSVLIVGDCEIVDHGHRIIYRFGAVLAGLTDAVDKFDGEFSDQPALKEKVKEKIIAAWDRDGFWPIFGMTKVDSIGDRTIYALFVEV